jgi:RNA ligase (TIGR02306 family)
MENNNSVCFVAKINEIKPIEGADNIELGIIGGWNCIIKKGQYKINDLVVVATTDAVIPIEISDAMNVTNYLRKGQRVRTVKLRGVYSECLIIPIAVARQWAAGNPKGKHTEVKQLDRPIEGQDLMEILGITKWEPPVVQIQLASGKKYVIKTTQHLLLIISSQTLKMLKVCLLKKIQLRLLVNYMEQMLVMVLLKN